MKKKVDFKNGQAKVENLGLEYLLKKVNLNLNMDGKKKLLKNPWIMMKDVIWSEHIHFYI